jgi:hypothetical protein
MPAELDPMLIASLQRLTEQNERIEHLTARLNA